MCKVLKTSLQQLVECEESSEMLVNMINSFLCQLGNTFGGGAGGICLSIFILQYLLLDSWCSINIKIRRHSLNE